MWVPISEIYKKKTPDLEALIYNPSVTKKIEVMAEELTRSFRVVAEIKDILPQKLSFDLHFAAYMNMYSYLQPPPTYLERAKLPRGGNYSFWENIYKILSNKI